LKASGRDNILDGGAIRLPNRVQKGLQIDTKSGTAIQGNDRDVMASPSNFLRGAASPMLSSFMATTEDDCI